MPFLDEPPRPLCGKCQASSGDDWTQCNGRCPVVGSPHFNRAEYRKHGDPAGHKPSRKK